MKYGNVAPGGLRTASVRAVVFALCWCGLIAGAAYGWYRFTPRGSVPLPAPPLPRVAYDEQGIALQSPTGVLAADVASFHDRFSAYLYYDYLRSREITSGMKVLLALAHSQQGIEYRVRMVLADELVSAVPYLADLQAKGYIGKFDIRFLAPTLLSHEELQTGMFGGTYSGSELQDWNTVPANQLVEPVARFLLFKSNTDPRVRVRNLPSPERLNLAEARRIAADMITVSRFYALPLELLLGVGAMENNYMHWAGDLRHTVWKPHPDPGDIVLKRARRRVLVRNYALGAWQITRETLRSVHKIYLKDTRDYSQLPSHLQPKTELDPDEVSLPVLTTYAGLLLRDLLDRKGGDFDLAAGAYNGGPARPNLKYAAGVRAVGDYARRIIQRELLLSNRPAANTRKLTADESMRVSPVAVSVPSTAVAPAE